MVINHTYHLACAHTQTHTQAKYRLQSQTGWLFWEYLRDLALQFNTFKDPNPGMIPLIQPPSGLQAPQCVLLSLTLWPNTKVKCCFGCLCVCVQPPGEAELRSEEPRTHRQVHRGASSHSVKCCNQTRSPWHVISKTVHFQSACWDALGL